MGLELSLFPGAVVTTIESNEDISSEKVGKLLDDLDLIEGVPPWYSPTTPKAEYHNTKARAFWDVPVFAGSTEVRANRIDVRIVEKETETVKIIEMSCPWIENRKQKSQEKTTKYAPLRWELKQQHRGYTIKQYNIIIDVLGGYSSETRENVILLLVKTKTDKTLLNMQKAVISIPGKPTELKAILRPDGNINVAWEKPIDPNGIIRKYQIYCVGKREYDGAFHSNLEIPTTEAVRFAVIKKTDLAPGTEFTVYITAFTSKGEGSQSRRMRVNTPAVAPPPPKAPEVLENSLTPSTVTLYLSPSTDRNGKVVAHQIIVQNMEISCKDEILSFNKSNANKGLYYIAAILARGTIIGNRSFVLGDGKLYGGYRNLPLEAETKYKVYIRGITKANGNWIYGYPTVINLPKIGSASILPKPCLKLDNSSKGPSLVWMMAAIIEGFFLLLLTMIMGFGYIRIRRKHQALMLSRNGTCDHYEIVDQAHAATRLDQTISVGRNNQHNAPQRTDEYAMLDRSGMKEPLECATYTALTKSEEASGGIEDVGAGLTESSFSNLPPASADRNHPTYVNVA
ncbi:receptor-type tyrosine-protein phosphatase kappa-like [Montipora foliosa]|uniref:receptor-type tyrosine-protein phosphatase kappa-like n=1 Tax=Montipora foliosa TaxID=591990 RepID=UPI0035F1AFCF